MKALLQRWRLALGLTCLALLAGLAGCGAPEVPGPKDLPALEVVPAKEWPLLTDDRDAASLYEACAQSLVYLSRIPQDRSFDFGAFKVSAARLAAAVRELSDVLVRYPDPVERTRYLMEHFVLLRSRGSDGQGRVLMTGYYEPFMEARRQPEGRFVHPLYPLPDDWVSLDLREFDPELPAKRIIGRVEGHKVRPYWDREAIDFQGALEGKAAPLAWLDDPVAAFFLHIQGSGTVVFADGTRLRLGYAGANGKPYRSIGRYLIDQGHMDRDKVSMQGIKAWLEAHPEMKRQVLSVNPSYVFFRPLDPEGGPPGAYGVPITAGRSIATDRKLFPGLAVGYVAGSVPAPGGGDEPLGRFIVNQDTGGAIKGPGRLDLFFGGGDQAGELAGRMKNLGRLYFLAPKPPEGEKP